MRGAGIAFTKRLIVLVAALVLMPASTDARQGDLPEYLTDRGIGVPSSMFGTYIEKGELIVYPYFEYYLDDDAEYSPDELGYELDKDFRGKFRGSEWLLFVGYGITDWMALELEAAAENAKLEKSADDPSNVPRTIEESGLGDVETQLRWRWKEETASSPEMFSAFEIVFPLQKDKVLIGTRDWEFLLAYGLTKGFSWGTMTARVAAEYSTEESTVEVGEYALEYLKRISPSWRVYLGVEGSGDEVELITEAQWHLNETVFVKLNNALGITSKATDWAPEIGIVFSFPLR